MAFDPNEVATSVTNELFYAEGHEPIPIQPRMAIFVKAAIAEAIWDAYNKGWADGNDAGKDAI
jgi:hypothetical protein